MQIEQLRRAESEMNAALAANLPVLFHTCRLEAAIDSHDEPFYGKSAALRPYCCGGAAKAGITHEFDKIKVVLHHFW